MTSIRRINNDRWQATVRLPDGRRRSATRDTRTEAARWGDHMELAAKQLAAATPGATFTWTPAGLDIHIPDSQITMDMAADLEDALRRVLNQEV